MANALATRTSQLPEGFGEPEWMEDTIVTDGIGLTRAGVSVTSPAGETITGSAASAASDARARAHYELLERVATLDAIKSNAHRPALDLRGRTVSVLDRAQLFLESPEPARYRYARSNGVALHQTFRRAALRARWELAERDRVLRSWLGETAPQRISMESEAVLGKSLSYRWEAHHFGRARFAPEADVIGVFGFPSRHDQPLAMGFAARPGREQALGAAAREALQSLSFLWGEEIPTSPPAPGPTPIHHLEHFQYPPHHDELRSWLAGEHGERDHGQSAAVSEVRYVSLTPEWLPSGLHVVKAVCDDALPLAFGDVPFLTYRSLTTHPIT